MASAGVVREALAAIRSLPFAAGAGAIASYLIGHGSTQIRRYDWQTRPQFGVLKHRREDWVRRLLRRFVASGVLAIDPEHQTLHVTRRTVDVINGVKPNPVRLPPEGRPTLRVGARDPRSATATLDGDAATLFERLKSWRRLRADADGVPAYVICHDATLAAIAEARPASGDELMQVNGMGPAKLQRYGLQILAEVRAHAAEHGERASAPSPATDDAVPAHLSRNFSEYQLRVRETHARSAYERWSDERGRARHRACTGGRHSGRHRRGASAAAGRDHDAAGEARPRSAGSARQS